MRLPSPSLPVQRELGPAPRQASQAHRAQQRARGRTSPGPPPLLAALQEETEKETDAKKSDEYSKEMADRMGSPNLTYRHEDGMNFNRILDDLIVGSCPQTPANIDRLAAEGVGAILCLQEDSDMDYFSLDLRPNVERCRKVGITHVRHRIRDFDGFALRRELPAAVAAAASQLNAGRTLYVHCTAGLGRAPATAISVMYWMRGFRLPDAVARFKRLRPCNPRIDAIRQATADMLGDDSRVYPATLSLYRTGGAHQIQVAGLDVGWGNRLDLQHDPKRQRHTLTRRLPPGKYPYKFVWDGKWSYSADHPTMRDGDHVNNYLEVVGAKTDAQKLQQQARLLSEEGELTSEEREQLEQRFSGLENTGHRIMGALKDVYKLSRSNTASHSGASL